MKKFLVFLILAGGGFAAWWFYDPYLKPYVEPMVEKVAGETPPEAPDTEKSNEPAVPKTTESSGAPKPESASPVKPTPAPEPAQSEIDRIVEERYPMPQIIPLRQIVGNWSTIPQRAFPEQVEIQDRVPFSLRDSSGKVIGASVAVPGTLVKPVRLQGQTLIVASLANGSMRSEIALDKTDMKKRIEKRYNDFIVSMTNQIRTKRAKAKKALMAKPEAVAALKGGGGAFDGSEDPRFAAVKASLASGKVKAFNLEEAVGFRWNGSEKINGDIHKGTFDTVTVKYEARTIFGVFPGEAKCLLSNGSVIGWVDPITEEEMI